MTTKSQKSTHLISCLQVFRESRISFEILWHKLAFSFGLYTWIVFHVGRRKMATEHRHTINFREGNWKGNTTWGRYSRSLSVAGPGNLRRAEALGPPHPR
jgi:hypothetical protein